MTCIIFSIPLALYPARSTLWKLIHTFMPSFPAVSFFLKTSKYQFYHSHLFQPSLISPVARVDLSRGNVFTLWWSQFTSSSSASWSVTRTSVSSWLSLALLVDRLLSWFFQLYSTWKWKTGTTSHLKISAPLQVSFFKWALWTRGNLVSILYLYSWPSVLIFGVFILFGNTSLVLYKELTAEWISALAWGPRLLPVRLFSDQDRNQPPSLLSSGSPVLPGPIRSRSNKVTLVILAEAGAKDIPICYANTTHMTPFMPVNLNELVFCEFHAILFLFSSIC